MVLYCMATDLTHVLIDDWLILCLHHPLFLCPICPKRKRVSAGCSVVRSATTPLRSCAPRLPKTSWRIYPSMPLQDSATTGTRASTSAFFTSMAWSIVEHPPKVLTLKLCLEPVLDLVRHALARVGRPEHGTRLEFYPVSSIVCVAYLYVAL